MGSSFIHLIRTDSNEFFLMAEVKVLKLGLHMKAWLTKDEII